MMYKLLNLVYDKNIDQESILHVLGVYGVHDRFHLMFLQRLYNDFYLKERESSVQISYDTINYFVSGLFKIRELDSIIPTDTGYNYGLNENLVNQIDQIIKYPDALQNVQDNIDCLINGKNLSDTRVYCYMNVVRQLIADSIMKRVIEEYDLVNKFLEFDNFNSLRNNWVPFFQSIEQKYPYIFKNYTSKIINNFQWIFSFHKWWMEGRDPQRLEKGLEVFIRNINFPKVIKDDRG